MQVHTLRDALTIAPTTTWMRWALRDDGRRGPQHAVVSAAAVHAGDVVVVDHAGPAASRWSLARAAGLDITTDPLSTRKSFALDDAGWAALVSAYASTASVVRARNATMVVAIDDDGLLHAALSPLASSPPQPRRVLELLEACAPCDLVLVVEDLAPRGMDASAGIAFAQQAVVAARSSALYTTAGTAWLPPLRDRRKGRSVDDVGFDLCSAAWMVGRVHVPVFGVVRSASSTTALKAAAHRLGLSGLVLDERTTLTTATGPTTDLLAPDPFESR